jgi:enamine deaminase RidA (YjgF/YER057c/UK114 family)
MQQDRINVSSGSPYEPIIGFSRAVRIGSIIAVGGTAPIGPDGKTVGVGDPAAQTRRCIEIIRIALEQAGASLADIIRTRTFLIDMAQWEAIGRAHGEVFGDIRPASTMVQVSGFIDAEWLVEIEADAVLPPSAAGVWPA